MRPFVCAAAFAATARLLATPLAFADAEADADARLAREVRLDDVVRVALARNPDVAESRARTAAAAERARRDARLPELQVKLEQWGAPLRRPWDLGAADTLMAGVRQTLPAPGSLRARAAVAEADRDVAGLADRTRRRELVAEVRRAFAAYWRTDQQLRLHQEHVELTSRLLEIARGAYRAGASAQQDVLRLTLELSRVHGQLARMEPERRVAAALLNTLMNRPPNAPLGPPAEPSSPHESTSSEAARPELAAAEKAVERSESAVTLAQQNATWPSLMLGLDYMYMPMNPHPHGYGAMVAVNVPWLSPGRRDEIRAAEQSAIADRRALESTRNLLRYELASAQAQHAAARASYDVIERDVVTAAERNFEAARAAYASGRGDALGLLDALRTYLDVRVDRVRARAELETAAAELARAGAQEATP